MPSLQYLALLLVTLAGLYDCELSVVPRNSLVILPPSPSDRPTSILILYCDVESNATEYTTTWTTPSGVNVTVNTVNGSGVFRTPDRRLVAVNRRNNISKQSVFVVIRLSYLDAGNYTCTVNVTDDGEESDTATVELKLLLIVVAVESERTARIGQKATLSCEMAWYIRNDSDFLWRIGDQLITDNEKYSITYADNLIRHFSRVSTLTIFSMETSDEGNYTCFVSDTAESATVQLTVDLSPPETTTPIYTSPSTISPRIPSDNGSFVTPLVISLSFITTVSFVVTLAVTIAAVHFLISRSRKKNRELITDNTKFKMNSESVPSQSTRGSEGGAASCSKAVDIGRMKTSAS